MKAIGKPGSTYHVFTNDKLAVQDKVKCLREATKEGIKDTLIIAGGTATAVGAASNADKIKAFASKIVKTPIKDVPEKSFKIAEKAAKKSFETAKKAVKNPGKAANKIVNSVKTNLNPKKVVNDVKALPKSAKIAILAGAAVLGIISSGKLGYFEGKQESK